MTAKQYLKQGWEDDEDFEIMYDSELTLRSFTFKELANLMEEYAKLKIEEEITHDDIKRFSDKYKLSK